MEKKWSLVLKDLILPALAILLTAYNVYSITTARKDSYNDILFGQQMAATSEIAEHLSVYQGELLALVRVTPQTPAEDVSKQAKRTVDAGRVFSKAFTKWAPILPDGLLLEVTRYHAVASHAQEPFRKKIQLLDAALPRQLEKELIRSYGKVFQKMRAELGVDTLNVESKQLLEKLQTERPTPTS